MNNQSSSFIKITYLKWLKILFIGFGLTVQAGMPVLSLSIFTEYGIRIEHFVDVNNIPTIESKIVPLNFGSANTPPRIDQKAQHEKNDFEGVIARRFEFGDKDRLQILSQTKETVFTAAERRRIGGLLLAQMKTNKIGNATYVFRQNLYPRSKRRSGVFSVLGIDPNTPMLTLTWSVSARIQDGYIFSTEPQIEDETPSIIYARYFSMRTDPSLDSSTRFNKAGILEFQLRDTDGNPLTDFVPIQTNGELDPSLDGNASVGTQCIAKKRGGCPNYPDIHSQMLATGSISGVFDYSFPVEPVVIDNGQDDSVQSDFKRTQMLIRDYNQTGCSVGEYRNAGVTTWRVIERVSRYTTFPQDAGPHIMDTASKETDMQTQYDKTVTLNNDTPYLQNYGIYPGNRLFVDGPGGLDGLPVEIRHDSLMTLTELRSIGVVDIPSIRKILPLKPEMNFILSSASSGMGAERIGSGRNLSINFDSGADVWPWSKSTYDRQLSFDIQNINYFTNLSLDNLVYDDHTLVYINGNLLFGGSYLGTTQLRIFDDWQFLPYDSCVASGTNLYDCGSFINVETVTENPDICYADTNVDCAGGCAVPIICEPQEPTVVVTQEFNVETSINALQCRLNSGQAYCHLFNPNNGKLEYSPGLFGEHSVGGDRYAGNFNLLPFIRNGSNTIQTRTLSGGGGNLSFAINSESCIEID